jgi:uncharacterized protein (DUF1697 family)
MTGSLGAGRSVAFIRNVMVGRQGLTREVLVRVFLDAGAHDPVSHLVTGNVSFGVSGTDARELRASVEQRIAAVIGRREPVFIRTVAALRKAVARAPFADAPLDDVFERCVSFADTSVRGVALPMSTPNGDAIVFATGGRELFSVTQRRNGRAGNPVRMIERALGRPVTTRNWNTIERIVRGHDPGRVALSRP